MYAVSEVGSAATGEESGEEGPSFLGVAVIGRAGAGSGVHGRLAFVVDG